MKKLGRNKDDGKIPMYEMVLDELKKPVLSVSGEVLTDGAMQAPEDIWEMAKSIGCDRKAEEEAYLLCMDSKGKPLGVFMLSRGSQSLSIFSVKAAITRALLSGASNIAIWHNHPSGNPTPSRDDKEVTKKMAEAGKLMETPLVDHVIVCDGSYYSFMKSGKLGG